MSKKIARFYLPRYFISSFQLNYFHLAFKIYFEYIFFNYPHKNHKAIKLALATYQNIS